MMNRIVSIPLVLAALATTPLCARADAPGVEFKLEVKVCAEAKGLVVKGGACWIMDPLKKTSVYEYQFCAGLVLDAGVLVAGLEGNVMVCGTLTVPIELAGDKQAWK